MATNTPTTGASTCAPSFSDAIAVLQSIQGRHAVLCGLIASASDELTTDGSSLAGINMIEASIMIADMISEDFAVAVAAGAAAMKGGASA